MATHRVEFTHDSHRFAIEERTTAVPSAHAPDARVEWHVRMDGQTVLEFSGDYPYRDEDLKKRVLEWYGLQKRTG